MRRLAALAVSLAAVGAAGCATSQTQVSTVPAPQLRIEEYFDGRTEAWGVFRDRFGNLRRQFRVNIEGVWDGQTLVLDEHFDYSDGQTERRVWTIRPTGPDTYVGTAADVQGVAQGRVSGGTLQWRYDLNLPVGGRTWTVDFDDRMYLQPDGVLINQAIVRKYGVKVGEAVIVFRRVEESATPAAAMAAE